MINYESIERNTFKLCNEFGYGQYLIQDGMYDLFLNELKSQSAKVLSEKEIKRRKREE